MLSFSEPMPIHNTWVARNHHGIEPVLLGKALTIGRKVSSESILGILAHGLLTRCKLPLELIDRLPFKPVQMTICRCIPFNQLPSFTLEAWSELLADCPEYQNPFLTPDFANAVASVRCDVEVLVIEENRKLVGIVPFQRNSSQSGIPVGGLLSNCQALIVHPEVEFRPLQILETCGLRSLQFHQLVDPAHRFPIYTWQQLCCRSIDLEQGFQEYLFQRNRETKKFKKIDNRKRKMERELGPIHFEIHSANSDVLTNLMTWKSAQFRRHLLIDLFQFDWVQKLLSRILTEEHFSIKPTLSALYAGGNLVAAAYDLQYGTVADAWFTAYDPRFRKYSPGSILLKEKLKEYPDQGINRYVLGAGEESYKQSYVTDSSPMFVGEVSRRNVGSYFRRQTLEVKKCVRNLPCSQFLRWPARMVRKFSDHKKLH